MGNGNFKVIALENNEYPHFTKGKVYRFANGRTNWDNGSKSAAYESFYDFRKRNPGLEVEEVKELVAENSNHESNKYFKARCIETKDCALTVGKVYEFINGYSKFDDETRMPWFCYNGIDYISNFNDLVKWFGNSTATKWELVTENSSFYWDGFRAAKFAVHCDTEEKAKLFFIELINQGIEWCNGRELKLNRTQWNRYEKETAYGFFTESETGISYGTYHSYTHPTIDYQPNFREVKRPAKVGEWIKIVDAKPHVYKQNYSNGDIFQVSMTNACFEKDVEIKNIESFIDYIEYVVLESIPQEPTQEESYKVDWSKISDKDIIEELTRRFIED